MQLLNEQLTNVECSVERRGKEGGGVEDHLCCWVLL